MRILIDNLDGTGAVDWTAQVAPEGPLRIVRRLHEPSHCGCEVLSRAGVLPRRTARVVVTTQDGTVLFTGYVTRDLDGVYAGESSEGAVYRARLTAESDEWLLDKQGRVGSGRSYGLSGGALLSELATRVDASRFAVAASAQLLSAGRFAFDAAKTWSANVAAMAAASYASYRVLAGAVDLQPAGAVQHALVAGTLQPAALVVKHGRELANDVTVSGAMEAGALVTEVFSGDGTTTEFLLSGAPFRGGAAVLVEDSFAAATISTANWLVSDPGSVLSVSSAGLVLGGGNGQDGATTLSSVDAVELAGGLVLEATSVLLTAGSDGVLLGVYSGAVSRANCVAGFSVRSANGGVTVQALVDGVETGTVLTLTNGDSYTFRLRLHSPAMQRVRQSYRVMVDGVVESFGGDLVDAPLSVVCEVRDAGASSNTVMTVLYDGAIADSVASASFVPVNAVQLRGSVGAFKAQQTGSAWVVSRNGSGQWTRLIGLAGEGVDCSLSTAGALRFFAGRVPAAGEQVLVSYSRAQRAVARRQDAASVAAEAASGMPGVASWSGHVLTPAAASSEDCANAAAALLAVAKESAAGLEGSFTGGAEGHGAWDPWPGDLLEAPAGAGGLAATTALLVRSVTLTDRMSAPERIDATVEFANDWAKPVALKLSDSLAADVTGVVAVWPASGSPVADLAGLTVVNVSSTAITVDTGTAPPSGGGFEVRRRDAGFGPGAGADLVLRSPVRGFSIPRSAQVESLSVRMYDGSTPPRYGLRSAGIVTDVPVG